jgi:tRNA modification GTPase
VIEAGSERAWRQAQVQLDGALGESVRDVRAGVTRVLAELEGAIDFPDDDLELRGQPWVLDELERAASRATALAASYQRGRLVSGGLEVALVGAVNVGKSSLLNALIGRERALVADQPGTTRDYVEASCEWNGYAVTIIDTAGERDAGGDVERRGIELGRRRSDAADVVVVVNDGTGVWDDGARFGRRAIVIRSKRDLGGDLGAAEVATSTITGEGLDALRARILERAGAAEIEGATSALVTTERQRAALVDAADKLTAAATALRGTVPLEMVVLDIRQADASLGHVLGEAVDERVLDELFARFCIGK